MDLLNISPIDGRYQKTTQQLNAYFSEYGLIKYRVFVEIKYLIALENFGIKAFKHSDGKIEKFANQILASFDVKAAEAIKLIEATTNHDVKAVEYWIKAQMTQHQLDEWKEWVHFGLTSQDINNTAIPLSLVDALNEVLIPELHNTIDALVALKETTIEIPMLARTHGQPASPTRLGKEIAVYVERLQKQLNALKMQPISAKFGGATGNFNAHYVTFPDCDWVDFANNFVSKLGNLERSQFTTQIDHYDTFAAVFHNIIRINNILIDFTRDIWQYISLGYFKQKIKAGEVGSSAMPHKVNPIDFENAEGNLGVANALLDHLAMKLPISRLQRDLTDSTVLRNLGTPMGHLLIALTAIQKGLNKLSVNKEAIAEDLGNNWAVVAEAIQSILRVEGVENPYEKLKTLTRTEGKITQKHIHDFIISLNIDTQLKEKLLNISPFNYVGLLP